MKKRKLFEVMVPAHEYWVYEVEATTKKEALAKMRDAGNKDVQQTCTLACSPGQTRPRVKLVRELEDEDNG